MDEKTLTLQEDRGQYNYRPPRLIDATEYKWQFEDIKLLTNSATPGARSHPMDASTIAGRAKGLHPPSPSTFGSRYQSSLVESMEEINSNQVDGETGLGSCIGRCGRGSSYGIPGYSLDASVSQQQQVRDKKSIKVVLTRVVRRKRKRESTMPTF